MSLLQQITAKQKSLLLQLYEKISTRLDYSYPNATPEKFRLEVDSLLRPLLDELGLIISEDDYPQLLEMVLSELIGFGLLDNLLNDPTVSDIYVLQYDNIYIKRQDKGEKLAYQFGDEEHLMRIIDRIVAPLSNVAMFEPIISLQMTDGWQATIFNDVNDSRSVSLILNRGKSTQ